MSVKYIQTGDAVDYTPGADVGAGDVVVQGDLVGVAKLDILTGKLGALVRERLVVSPRLSAPLPEKKSKSQRLVPIGLTSRTMS